MTFLRLPLSNELINIAHITYVEYANGTVNMHIDGAAKRIQGPDAVAVINFLEAGWGVTEEVNIIDLKERVRK